MFPRELARAERDKKIFASMIIDVDYLKPCNDNYGYQQGDLVLQQVSSVLKNTLRRAGDFAFRIGGEEFGVIVNVDHEEEASAIAEKLRAAVADLGLAHAHNPASGQVTVSIGLKTHQGSGGQPALMELIYRRADDALYQAKENGRNQVVRHSDLEPIQKTGSDNG